MPEEAELAAGLSKEHVTWKPRHNRYGVMNEVVRMTQLFKCDKLAILNSWKDLEEQEAQSENSDCRDNARRLLREVEEAIRQVG